MTRTPAALLAVLLAALTLPVLAAPAEAASRVTVRNDRGGADADTTYATRLSIDGTGFQPVRGGFGGVYVLFGWVDDPSGDSWKPSQGGLTGQDYRYLPDAENAEANRGYLRFIAFPGSSTAAEANAVMSGAGAFRVDLTVPGPVFESVDRDGAVSEVDCRTMTCGVITIGAHGVKNARNETFTRVRFDTVYDDAAAAAPTVAPTAPAATATPAATPAASETSAPVSPAATTATGAVGAVGAATVTTDRATAVAGRALAFTGTGFAAGEQVLAILDDGVAAVGPMVAGGSGEVAGLLQLPLDLGPGTHELRLTGAASGTAVAENFPVQEAETTTAVAADASAPGAPLGTVFLAVAAVVFVLALGDLVRRQRRRAVS